MFKYRKVGTSQQQSGKPQPNEIRVGQAKPMRNYLGYIYGLHQEKKLETITVHGLGNVIPKCLAIGDNARRRIKDLDEIIEFGTVEIEDTYEPTEEGLDKVVMKRKLPFIKVTLSIKPLDKSHPGYHEHLPESEIMPLTARPKGEFQPEGEYRPRRRFGRRFRRGGGYGNGGYGNGGYGNEGYGYGGRRSRRRGYGRNRYEDEGYYGAEERNVEGEEREFSHSRSEGRISRFPRRPFRDSRRRGIVITISFYRRTNEKKEI
jgi:hypothetical protein